MGPWRGQVYLSPSWRGQPRRRHTGARNGAPALAPGLVCLFLFAVLLTRVDAAFAGRAYAAYGGIYIGASLAWLWLVEARTPDVWDVTGAFICAIGAAVILYAPRAA